MDSSLYNKRKQMIYDFMCDDMYVPMKIKELSIVLGVSKQDRPVTNLNGTNWGRKN